MLESKYKRILLKLSGEALLGCRQNGIDPEIVSRIATEIKQIQSTGVKVAISVGGGNIYRGGGAVAVRDGIAEETSHYIGMMAIDMNCLALADLFNEFGVENKALSALGSVYKMDEYTILDGKKAMDSGKILLLGGGTGKPFVTSDSGAAMRAVELGCDVILKATKVDGVYDKDPVRSIDAVKYNELTFSEAIAKNLKVMDQNAFLICQRKSIPIVVFKLDSGNILRALNGEIGTFIK
jgi:uridylate kinase